MNENLFPISQEPLIHVGILHAPTIAFRLNGCFTVNGQAVSGEQTARFADGHVEWNGQCFKELSFEPQHADTTFSLFGVTIGIHFHWERQEVQTFQGSLRFIPDGEEVVAINDLPVEDYLTSVISSEMSATASLEFLKAHAIISRSWLLSQILKKKLLEENQTKPVSCIQTTDTYIRWYDREDHQLFDVCADDHCQRYQGVTKATNPNVVQAVQATRGMVLTDGHAICDARFSKCCGGISEEFQYAWEDHAYPYLKAVYDRKEAGDMPDLTVEANAEKWIRQSPEAFCNTHDKHVLSQVLNNFDQETQQFYRWKVDYTQDEIAKLIKEKSGIDFGNIIDLIPVERGKSGRLSRLKIVGTKRTLTIGKELEIRRTLSPTHLYSSAFIIEKGPAADGLPQSFHLIGAGWGHGVGLCQIGAAVMGEQGYSFRQILFHYYKNAQIMSLYS
ncbi:MAG: SpoIID/LytB domain-containing protein [Phocaeicola sp.]|nr:SpoIID/LytB domain-containing protein [Phocaeicola sp.]